MFKKLFMVALFMVLSISTFTSVVKADVYEYENIQELEDYVASVINKKNTYDFKYTFKRDDYNVDFSVTVNWNKRTVHFNGFVRRPENHYQKEKFNAVLNLKNNKVKTSSKLYGKRNNTLGDLLSIIWGYNREELSSSTLGHYLINVVSVIGKNTTYVKTGDKLTVSQAGDTKFYSKVEVSKSSLIKMEVEVSGNGTLKIKLK